MADFRIVTTAISSRGSTIFTERLDYLTFKDKSRGTLGLPLAGFFEVQDGKVKEWREYLELGTVEEAAGTKMRCNVGYSSRAFFLPNGRPVMCRTKSHL
jgi:limonene-1,2-epoxide hydrolase